MSRSVLFKGTPVTLLGNEIKVGDKAPDFTALKTDMSPVKLSDFAGKNVIIAAFPSVDTGICALQTTRFNQEIAKFNKDDFQLLTVSVDLSFALGRFCGDKGIENALTISDHKDLDFGTKYGFTIAELRLLARGTVIIDKEGIVKFVEYTPEIGTEPNYDKALEVLESLA